MSQTITIPVTRAEKERLSRLALRYGLSLSELSRKVLTDLEDSFAKESFKDYKNPKALKTSLTRAIKDFNAGRAVTSL